MTTELQDRALNELHVAGYFGLTMSERFWYRVLRLVYHRRELVYARHLLAKMATLTPLTQFSRGNLLGMLEAWTVSGCISSHVYTMLAIKVQDNKYWAADGAKDSSPEASGYVRPF